MKKSLALFAVLGLFAQPALAEDLIFDLTNESSLDLMALYVAPSDSDSWGDDILGMDILAAGEAGQVTIADGEETCAYDLRFEMADGSLIEGSTDLCATHSFTLTN